MNSELNYTHFKMPGTGIMEKEKKERSLSKTSGKRTKVIGMGNQRESLQEKLKLRSKQNQKSPLS